MTESIFDSERYNSTFAKILREELCVSADDVKALAKHLGCSVQAINQYKLGLSLPKVENLIKIAQFYDCNLNYLIGLSKVRTPDFKIEEIEKYTGLSQKAIEQLHNMDHNRSALIPILENDDLYSLCVSLYLSYYFVEVGKKKGENRSFPDSIWHFPGEEKLEFNSDDSVSIRLSNKQAAKRYSNEAKGYFSTIIETVLQSAWEIKEDE